MMTLLAVLKREAAILVAAFGELNSDTAMWLRAPAETDAAKREPDAAAALS